MTTLWQRLLSPAQFITADYGAVSVTLASADGEQSGTLDALLWDGQQDVADGSDGDEAVVKRTRALLADDAVEEILDRPIAQEDVLTYGGNSYRVVQVQADPPGADTMREVELELIERIAGYAESGDRRRG
jgi:hypothetical protein